MRYSIALFAGLASAWSAPNLTNYDLVWQDTFSGDSGAKPCNDWEIVTDISVNNEIQKYTASNKNLQISGGDTLQIIPVLSNDNWTSGRIESNYTFAPAAGKSTIAEAVIRFGDNSVDTKKGMWPAFWMLSDSCRNGGTWPSCGEVDVLEMVNGDDVGYGTVHCDVVGGGACKEPTGIQSSVDVPDQDWHRWRVVFDRTSSNWTTETMKWYRDDTLFQTVTGAEVGLESAWTALAHDSKYFILNVAVGGNWPGSTNSSTKGGYGAMMEVAYVAHYESSSNFTKSTKNTRSTRSARSSRLR